jgi:AraC family transcriptional regulator
MEARITSLEPARVAFVRHVGSYSEVGSAWQRIHAWAGQRGLLRPDARAFGLCHGDPDTTPPERLRYDACIEVGPDVQPDGGIEVQDVAGGRYAVATHRGSYAKLAETYGALREEWMPANRLALAEDRPSVEVYRNNPQQTPEDELLTDVHVPVQE